jgi:Trypsin-like serine proteases, typically periplasmic, contain C-terminal PDZ domain
MVVSKIFAKFGTHRSDGGQSERNMNELMVSNMKSVTDLGSVTQSRSEAANEAFRRLYEDVLPATVEIESEKGNGTGFFVDEKGRVATASHVVLDARELFATTTDGKRYRARIVKLGDTDDISLLELQNYSPKDQKHLDLKPSAKVTSSDQLYSIGFPYGTHAARMTSMRIVSNVASYEIVDKNKVAQEFIGKTGEERNDWLKALARPVLQGDASVAPGSSGGPLIDESGRVVGVNNVSGRKEDRLTYFVRSENLDALISEASKFNFVYERERAPIKESYLWGWSNSWSAKAGEPNIGRTAQAVPPYYESAPTGNSYLSSVTGGISYPFRKLQDDYYAFKQSTDTVDSLKYGLATVFDATVVAGAATVPFSRPIGALSIGLGLAGRVASDYIPNRLVLKKIERTDGNPRAPFNWRSVNLN